MAQTGEGKVIAQGPARTRFIVVPAVVAGDSAFPFEDGGKVTISIEGDRLIVEKAAPDPGDPDA
ncbi:MAG: hypothetical protein GX885_11080 [Methanomicrobiales archaeon]|jgi:hypothetical protein|nr:hypothetical protein [Methanomicrobiales archaeon]